MTSPIQQTFVQWSQPYAFDNGSMSSVAINDSGTVLEIHNGPSGNNGMYYRLGAFTTQPSGSLSSCIAWQPVQSSGMGDGNCLSAAINDQFAVQVYQASDKNLIFQWASLPASTRGQLSWSPGQNYTSGEFPAAAMNNANRVIAVHQSSKITSNTLWYATGVAGKGMGSAAQILQSNGSSVSGFFMQVAINDRGLVVVGYRGSILPGSTLAPLNFIVGTLQSNGSVVFGRELESRIAIIGQFGMTLDNSGNLLILCATSTLNKSYLGWVAGTVSGATILLPAQLPTSLNFDTFLATSVTLAMNEQGNLIAETRAQGGSPPPFQYFVGQAFFNMDYSRWMRDNLATIGKIPLNLLALPGTHDSGAYSISSLSDISPDNAQVFLSKIAPAVGANWAQSQDLTVLGQLNAGIRYFDLRVCHVAGPSSSLGQQPVPGYYLCHAFYGAKLDEVFADIRSFYQQGGAYAQEIVLLDMNHIYTNSSAGVNWGGGEFWMPGGPNGEFPALCQFVTASIGDLLLPPSLLGQSLEQIFASPAYLAGGRVLLFFDDTYSLQQNPNFWPNVDSDAAQYWTTVDGQSGPAPAFVPTINSYWPAVASLVDLVAVGTNADALPQVLQKVLAPAWSAWLARGEAPSQFSVLQCLGTPGGPEIKAGINPFGDSPPSLQSWEAGICSPSLFWLAAQPSAVAVNVVLVDWLEQTVVTPLCIALNQQKAKASGS